MQRRRCAIFALICLASSINSSGQSNPNGVYVGSLKVYNNRSLQVLLNGLKARLNQMSGLDQATLTKSVGGLQGARFSQLQAGVQAGPSTSIPSFIPSAPLPPSSAADTTTTATPTPPPSFTLPSSFAPSSLDTLAEQMQLNYEIINLQLLLGGSLSDQLVAGSNSPKRQITVGFPVSIQAPEGKQFNNAMAEVEVTVCNPPLLSASNSTDSEALSPSVTAILPQEKTYNVASIVSKSISAGAGSVAAVFNVGGGVFASRQTYFLVQDQDTLAIQRPTANVCPAGSRGVTFGWQFRPVLGQKRVRSGIRQMFVQLAIPPGAALACSAHAHVTTRWLKYQPKTGIVGKPLDEYTAADHDIPNFELAPVIQNVGATDNGDGTLNVAVEGSFLPGTKVRIGRTLLDENSSPLDFSPSGIRFVAPGHDLALLGLALVEPDGNELAVWEPDQMRPNQNVDGCTSTQYLPLPDTATSPTAEQPTKAAAKPATVQATARPYRDGVFELQVPLQPATIRSIKRHNPLVATIGPNVFGLSDLPFRSEDDETVTFLVSKDLLGQYHQVRLKTIFGGPQAEQSYQVRVADFSPGELQVLSSDASGSKFALSGAGLRGLRIVEPATPLDAESTDMLALFVLSAHQLAGLQRIVVAGACAGLAAGCDAPVLLSVPGTPAKPPKRSLAPQKAPLPVGGKHLSLQIGGTDLEDVQNVLYLAAPLPFRASLDAKWLEIDLPDALAATPGVRFLDVSYSDKTVARYPVAVGAKGKSAKLPTSPSP